MPTPSPGHEELERLAGSWEGEETMHPSQWDPKGGVAVGRYRYTVSLGGFALIADYEQERDGETTFTGHGVYTFDPEKELYSLHWFDCMGTPPEVFVGGFDGDELVMGHGGPGMHARTTNVFTGADAMTAKMEMSPDGEVWSVLFDAVYRRV